MSFVENHGVVQNGDTVILFLGHNSMQTIKVVSGRVHQTKYGAFPHDDFIGKEFGTKVYAKKKKGWIYILHPSPELWTVTLPHRTQILYTTDISLITLELELKPGSVVIESGTGSGSISHAFIRTIMPNGHLYTFDFHQQRTDQARKDFEDHEISQYVTGECRDVCETGFGLNNVADAVFLDLPKPWFVVKFAKEALKRSGGRLCSFSPCIEQVQKTCEQLRQLGFCEIKTVECLCNSFDVRTVPLPEARFNTEISQRKSHEKYDHEHSANEEKAADSQDNKIEVESGEKDSMDHKNKDMSTLKRHFTDSETNKHNPHFKKQKAGYINTHTARPVKEIPGHTGYLTFASLLLAFDKS